MKKKFYECKQKIFRILKEAYPAETEICRKDFPEYENDEKTQHILDGTIRWLIDEEYITKPIGNFSSWERVIMELRVGFLFRPLN